MKIGYRLAVLGALAIAPSALLGQASDLGSARTFRDSQQLLVTYPSLPKDAKAKLLEQTPDFAERFLDYVDQYPETNEFRDIRTQARTRIVDGEVMVTVLSGETPLFTYEASMPKNYEAKFAEASTRIKGDANKAFASFIGVLNRGVHEKDAAVKDRAWLSIGAIAAQHYQARLPLRIAICGEGEFADYIVLRRNGITTLVRDLARKYPSVMLHHIEKRREGWQAFMQSMAEVRQPSVKPSILSAANSKDEELMQLGRDCLMNWPIPEALPSLIGKYGAPDEEDGSYGWFTLLTEYGAPAAREVVRRWSGFSEKDRLGLIDDFSGITANSSLDVLDRALKDPSLRVRVKAVNGIGELIRYADAGSKFDVARARRTLADLTSDKDESVRAAAEKALHSLPKPQ